MKITPSNYMQKMSKVDIKQMIPEMQEFHNIISEIPSVALFKEWYDTDAEIRDCIQFYFDRLEKYLQQQPEDDFELKVYMLNLNLKLAAAKLKLLKEQQSK